MSDTADLRGPALDPLLEHIPAGFLSVAEDGTIAAANATMAEMLGYAAGELDGMRVDAILTTGARLFWQTHFFPLVRMHGRADEVFLVLRGADGGQVAVLANAVRREHGGAWASECVMMQVRERRRFEEELLRAKKEAELARAESEEHARELGEANELLEQQAIELELQQEQLREQTVELEMQADHLRALNDELTERSEELERQRAAAEDANRAKSSFLAVMSHELRTPLNAISGYVQLMEMEIHGPVTPAQRQALDRIGRSQKHLLRLINDVLNLARIEAGRVEYMIEPVELAALMADVTAMVEPQAQAKGLVLEVSVPPGVVARADREKVQQIVINLLSNAIKFTPSGGHISVDARRGGGQVRLHVSDTGIGIAPDKHGSVFDPFVQVDMSRTRGSEGSGLGLAISRDLARGMGGELSVQSTPGSGSTFTLTLPPED